MTKLFTFPADLADKTSCQAPQPFSSFGRAARRASCWMPMLVSLALAACASAPTASPEEQVRQRATERWQALVALDFDKAYGFAAPSYRQINAIDAYKANKQGVSVKWLGAKVIRVTCEEKKCAVRIELESKPVLLSRFNQTMTGGIDETWVLEDGRWWMLEAL